MNSPHIHTRFSLPSSTIQWSQVIALAGMLAAILFSFMIYGVYQPMVLTQLGFPRLAQDWLIYQGLLGVIVEPGLGGLSDRILAHTGSRLPQITIGITIAGGTFVILAFLLPQNLPTGFRWLFLGLMIVWLIAMIAIRGPITALLRQFAPVDQIPSANGLIILVLALVSVVFALVTERLQTQSVAIAFLGCAIVLMFFSTLLYRLTPPTMLTQSPALSAQGEWITHQRRLRQMLMVGMLTGLLMQVVRTLAATHLYPKLLQLSADHLTALMLLITALTANLWGWLICHWGATKGSRIGLVAIAGLCLIMPWPVPAPVAMVLLIAAGAAMGLILISMVPFALSSVPLSLSGLSTGLFFGGYGLGMTLELIYHRLLAHIA